MERDITLEAVRAMAADAGLTRLSDEHLQQLLRATRLAHARRNALRGDELQPSDEPAHVFRLDR